MMREGFSLITSVFVIVFIATISGLILNISGKTIQETSTQYKKEQSILHAKSYTELAIMAATSSNCIKSIKAEEGSSYNKYKIEVNVRYIGNDVNSIAGCSSSSSIGGVVNHFKSKGNAIILDTYVKYKDPFSSNDRDVVYYRRTVQKL